MHHMYTVGLDVDKDNLVFTTKILLYAGNSFINNSLVLFTNETIYLLQNYLEGQSAGNLSISTRATAATKDIYNKLPQISEHRPKFKKNLSEKELGYFLAGLIEGAGSFEKKELQILFTEKDTYLAYYLKSCIGYGTISKIKGKKIVRYKCKHIKGLFYILSLINGKLVGNSKYEQLILYNYSEYFNINIIPPVKRLSMDNYWLSGFTQANGTFSISILKSKNIKTKYSIRLEYSLIENEDLPLKLLHSLLKKGKIYQYNTEKSCYKSSGYKTAANLIHYFDKYNVFAGKYISYLKFRKVYIMITEDKHLEDKGVKKIISIATKGSSETSTQEI